MKKWLLSALAALSLASGSAYGLQGKSPKAKDKATTASTASTASNAGPKGQATIRIYSSTDTVVAGDSATLTAVAITRTAVRDLAPRLSWRTLTAATASVQLATTHTATLRATAPGEARVEVTYWYEQNPGGQWRKVYDTLYVPVVPKVTKPPVDTVKPPPVDTVKPPPVDTVKPPPVDTVKPPPVDTIRPVPLPVVGFDTVFSAYIVSRDSAAKLGGAYALFDQRYDVSQEKHWTNYGANWEVWYYDGGYGYLAQWRRGGNPVYKERGLAIAKSYLNNYLLNGNQMPTQHMYQADQLMTYYLLTGDDVARYAMVRVANGFLEQETNNTRGNWGVDPRIKAKYLTSFLWAKRVGGDPRAPITAYVPWSPTWSDPSATWSQAIDWEVNSILTWIDANGYVPTYYNGCAVSAQQNFMVALMQDALIKSYTYHKADPRIIAAVKRTVDFMRASQWKGTGFQYATINTCTDLSLEVTPDLNGLFAYQIGWLAKQLGDPTYKLYAEQVFAATVANEWIWATGNPKQFDQGTYMSWKLLGYR